MKDINNSVNSNQENKRKLELNLSKKYHQLLAHCIRLTGDRHTGEDVLHNAIVRSLKSIDALKDLKKIDSWIYTIIFRENLRRFEKKHIYISCDCDNSFSYEAELVSRLMFYKQLDKVYRLPHIYKVPFLMKYYNGNTYKEIAKELSLTSQTVATRINRAKQKINEKEM
ncbi:sigma-70 family RNA polymerase sigma factor [Vibrio sp. Sgm 5]|uniref:sigma-70 family RNA polymerase sigma factor n=1 Tax=Vibrio sp. Sgm 5 TaxID=2994387 RepID=UPI002248C2EE|nr:sigma-70 family RNA polymerase sigma factor [Vibrio sp. Sgm 5]MCX2789536.1 sigma-70 family RNA polymerase sigma factor [Vibrio sp. Sgm 5]